MNVVVNFEVVISLRSGEIFEGKTAVSPAYFRPSLPRMRVGQEFSAV
jgi:hypothetical protein